MNLRALENAITAWICPYWEDVGHVVNLIGSGCLISELNAM